VYMGQLLVVHLGGDLIFWRVLYSERTLWFLI